MTAATVVWAGWPTAPAPLGAILRARRGGSGALVVDDAGRPVPWGPFVLVCEAVRGLWQRALDVVIAAIAGTFAGRRSPPLRDTEANPTGPTVLVLPVLPDLSHTFVYREVLALLCLRPHLRIVVLERNERAPVHAEARTLLPHAMFLPRDGVTVRALRLLRWLLWPAGRQLFALYRTPVGGSEHDLLGKNPLRDARHPGNAFVLADLLAPLRPRHVHVYSSTWPANVVLGACHLLGVPFSISSYVDFEFAYSHKLLDEKIARARFFRVVTAFCAARLRELPGLPALSPERVPIVYLGLDLENWQQRATPSGQGILVSAARLVPKKGLHVVPAALAALRTRGIACRWRVIGDGPELLVLQQACAQHDVADLVDFLGPRDNATVRQELLNANVALLPCVIAADGERDGIPIFLCEAMALGVPVVTTPVSGIPELVRDGDTGMLAPPGDSGALADAIEKLLRDPGLARAVGERGRQAVRSTLDVGDKASQLIAHIER